MEMWPNALFYNMKEMRPKEVQGFGQGLYLHGVVNTGVTREISGERKRRSFRPNVEAFFHFPYGLYPKKHPGTKWLLVILLPI